MHKGMSVVKKLINRPEDGSAGSAARHGARLSEGWCGFSLTRLSSCARMHRCAARSPSFRAAAAAMSQCTVASSGAGMLDAACPGAVFTSPTPDQMLAASQIGRRRRRRALHRQELHRRRAQFRDGRRTGQQPRASTSRACIIDDDVAVQRQSLHGRASRRRRDGPGGKDRRRGRRSESCPCCASPRSAARSTNPAAAWAWH
jgi:hypothetical protein